MDPAAAPALPPLTRPKRGFHIALGIVQGLVALTFAFAGFTKLTRPYPELVQMMIWPGVFSPGTVRFIGGSELLGALGLSLPVLFRTRTGLVPLAALGLLTIQVLAFLFHLSRGEYPVLPINIILIGLTGFVAWGRYRKASLATRE